MDHLNKSEKVLLQDIKEKNEEQTRTVRLDLLHPKDCNAEEHPWKNL